MTKPADSKKPAVSSKSTDVSTAKTRKAAPKATAKVAKKPIVPAASEVRSAGKAANRAASASTSKSAGKPAIAEATPSAVKSAPKAAVASNGLVPEALAKSKAPAAASKSGVVAETKAKKAKLVRDSFTMPASEYQILNDMKKAALQEGFVIKKSELLRIGVALIQKTDVEKIRTMLEALTPLKAGRPKTER